MRGSLRDLCSKACGLIALIAISGCSTFVNTPTVHVDERAKKYAVEAYSHVLSDDVNEAGQIDFSSLSAHRDNLNTYVAFVSQANFDSFQTPSDRLAHFLNSYNALSMNVVLEKGIPKSNSGLRKVKFFFLTKMLIAGNKMSLYDFEKDYVRKAGDERVHFALNCMSVSCPRLPRKPFTGENLNAELNKEAKFFFSEPRNLRVDDAKKTIYISEILKFFTEDFVPAKAPSLHAYISKYTDTKLPSDYKIEFIDYDWTINNSRR